MTNTARISKTFSPKDKPLICKIKPNKGFAKLTARFLSNHLPNFCANRDRSLNKFSIFKHLVMAQELQFLKLGLIYK